VPHSEGQHSNPRDSGPRGRTALVATLGLGLAAWVAAGRVPFPPLDPEGFISGYGSADNRRLLLRYAWLVVAAILGPLAARGWEEWRGRAPREALGGLPRKLPGEAWSGLGAGARSGGARVPLSGTGVGHGPSTAMSSSTSDT